MRNNNTDSNILKRTFSSLLEKFDGTLTNNKNDYHFVFKNDTGEGCVRATAIPNDINYYEFDVTFQKDISFTDDFLGQDPIYFVYISAGTLYYNHGQDANYHSVKPNQKLIYAGNSENGNTLMFQKCIHYKLCFIEVNNPAAKATDAELDAINAKINATFRKETLAIPFIHVSSYSRAIEESLEQLQEIAAKGVVKALLIQGIVTTMLALEIQQYLQDMEGNTSEIGVLTVKELQIIKKLSDSIRNHPENPHTIERLCNEGQLSSQKIQEGFHVLHDCTVTNFIKDERLKMAEKLIRDKNITVSEVVYSVGLTSRSYFSKIFKKKYKCSPKYYQDNQLSVS